MPRAQLLRPADPYKFKQGDWVHVIDPLSGRKRVGVVHSRGSEEDGEDTLYGVALKVDGGFAIPQWFKQNAMEATESQNDVAGWQRFLAQKAKNDAAAS